MSECLLLFLLSWIKNCNSLFAFNWFWTQSKGMNYSRGKPLFVKEVVLPNQNEPEISDSYFKKNSVTAYNPWKNGLEKRVETSLNNSVKIGDHEVRSVGLLILQKKPLENYFEGTARKKQIRGKRKHKKVNQSLRELDWEEIQIKSNGEEKSIVNKEFFNEEESVVRDQKIERENLLLKIEKFEKMKEQRNQNSYIRQRLAEEKYIQQLANLAKTWCKFTKKRNELEHLNSNFLTHHKPHFFSEETSKNCKIGVSNVPQKHWNDYKDKFKEPEDYEERKESILDQSSLDNLDDVFFEKLALDDEKDINDFHYRRRSFRRKRNLN